MSIIGFPNDRKNVLCALTLMKLTRASLQIQHLREVQRHRAVETMSLVIPQQALSSNQILNHPARYRKSKEQTDLEQVLTTRRLEVPGRLQRVVEEMHIEVPHRVKTGTEVGAEAEAEVTALRAINVL